MRRSVMRHLYEKTLHCVRCTESEFRNDPQLSAAPRLDWGTFRRPGLLRGHRGFRNEPPASLDGGRRDLKEEKGLPFPLRFGSVQVREYDIAMATVYIEISFVQSPVTMAFRICLPLFPGAVRIDTAFPSSSRPPSICQSLVKMCMLSFL